MTALELERIRSHLDDWQRGAIDGRELVIDLLVSTRHFADVHAVDFAAADAVAYQHYRVERSTGGPG